jgi:hypothetical protein
MRVLAVLWLIFMVVMCLSPMEVKYHLHTMGQLHKAYHVLAFFIAACLLAWPVRSWPLRLSLLSVVAAFAYLTEWLEHVAWHNPLEWRDVRVDLNGVILALLAMLISARSAKRRAQSRPPTPLVSIADVPQSTPEHHL